MNIHTTTSARKTPYDTWLIVLTALTMLLAASTPQSRSCICETKDPRIEWNIGLKDLFFKYPNL